MKIIKVSQLKKGDYFRVDDYQNSWHELCFTAYPAGGYGGKEGEGKTMYVLTRSGFEFKFQQIWRKNNDKAYVAEEEDFEILSEVENRIRQTAKYVELYKIAEENSDKENLVGTYPNSAEYGTHAFSRGDIVKDCYGRLGVVLGVDGHSIAVIKRVDYRVEVNDCGKIGTGIFKANEITKIGKMEDVSNLTK